MLQQGFFRITSPFAKSDNHLAENDMQALSIECALEKLLPENFFEDLDKTQNDYLKEERRALFESLLPFVSWSTCTKTPCALSVFFICHPTSIKTLAFAKHLLCHSLTPGKALNILSHNALEFIASDLSEDRYIYCEITVEVEFARDLEKIQRKLPLIAAEIRRGITSASCAQQSLEKKEAFLPWKVDLIYDDLYQVHARLPAIFTDELFKTFHHFLLAVPSAFRSIRKARHISRTLCYLFYKCRSIRQMASHLSFPKHVQVKMFPTKLHFPFGTRKVTGIVIALSLLKDRQFFDEALLMDAIQSILPTARLVKNSYFMIDSVRSIGVYIEIENTDGSPISYQMRLRLERLLPSEIRGHIEELIHPIFMPRNDEEIYQSVIKLGGALTAPTSKARVLITYDQQVDDTLVFSVVCVRLIRLDAPPLSATLTHLQKNFSASFDQVKVIGKLDNTLVKEANIFSLKAPKKKFLRKDGFIDLHKAKNTLFQEIKKDLIDGVDVHAELMESQEHLFESLKMDIPHLSKNQEYILEGLFYSMTPMNALCELSIAPIKELFFLLLEVIDGSSSHKLNDCLFMEHDEQFEYAVLRSDDATFKDEIDLMLSSLNIAAHHLMSSYVCIHGTHFFTYVCRSSDSSAKGFSQTMQEAAKNWIGKSQKNQVLNLPMPATSSIVPDPKMGYDHESGMIMQFLFEGLMTIDDEGNVAYASAEKVELSKDRKTYRFTLRKSQWSNGQPVIAYDFEFAWKRMIDPNFNTVYSYLFFILKNAKNAHEKKCSLDDVGVRAEDNKTLVVQLEQPSPYFLELTAQWPLFPVSSGTILNPGWSNVPREPHAANGPFKLVRFKHGQELKLSKNPFYWDKSKVKLDHINFALTNNIQTEMQMFENGEIDWAGSFRFPLPVETQKSYEKKGVLSTSQAASTYNYFFNVTSFPFTNKKMRQAFGYAINREALVSQVFLGKEIPSTTIFPPQLALTKTPLFKDGDLEYARTLFNEALHELGIGKKQLPTIIISHLNIESRKQIAMCIQQQWISAFGIRIELEELEWEAYFNKTTYHNFHICGFMWYMCYNDPAEFLEYFKYSSNRLNCTHWEHPDFIKLLDSASGEYNITQRRKKLAKVEKILIEEMPVIPLYANVNTFLKKDYVKGVTISNLGDVSFKSAYIDKSGT